MVITYLQYNIYLPIKGPMGAKKNNNKNLGLMEACGLGCLMPLSTTLFLTGICLVPMMEIQVS
jgi:hypothetical protein